ncbi:DUF2254 domain-containing protein [Azospirillum sp. A39]|uniref:DUF2254 domain-containing protein n=1 Tax=Azospirillum sp. A39 TaxID=3462279 RepID=UPI004045998C
MIISPMRFWERTRRSYWFVPSVMAVAAFGLSFVTIAVDGLFAARWLEGVGWLYLNKPDGARALLSTLASSIITVAGVAFSITIAAFAQATAQYGPRLITNFMRDRSNQVTLGAFIATYVYCLMVLRTIHADGDGGIAFVPHLSVTLGMLFGLVCMGFLIYFFHHIPESLNVTNLVAAIGEKLARELRAMAERPPGPRAAAMPSAVRDQARAVACARAGYVQRIDEDGLVALAARHDLVVVLPQAPGGFVRRGRPIARVWPPDRCAAEVAAAIHRAVVVDPQRSPTQDVLFLVEELTEVAARALSPSSNDPFIAMTCLDWLAEGLAVAARGTLPDAARQDDRGVVRLWRPSIDFAALLDEAVGRLRPYLRTDRNAALHMLAVLTEVAGEVRLDGHRRALLHHAEGLAGALAATLSDPDDRETLNGRLDRLRRAARREHGDGTDAPAPSSP